MGPIRKICSGTKFYQLTTVPVGGEGGNPTRPPPSDRCERNLSIQQLTSNSDKLKRHDE